MIKEVVLISVIVTLGIHVVTEVKFENSKLTMSSEFLLEN